MLTHQQIWAAIDTLAANHGMSASGLARRAGLDATTFNKSKRVSPLGRLRWPSTESVSKVLEVTNTSMDDFLNLLRSQGGARKQKVPLLGLALPLKVLVPAWTLIGIAAGTALLGSDRKLDRLE